MWGLGSGLFILRVRNLMEAFGASRTNAIAVTGSNSGYCHSSFNPSFPTCEKKLVMVIPWKFSQRGGQQPAVAKWLGLSCPLSGQTWRYQGRRG